MDPGVRIPPSPPIEYIQSAFFRA